MDLWVYTARYKGKEGFKTIMYNMSVAHDGRIYNIAGTDPTGAGADLHCFIHSLH